MHADNDKPASRDQARMPESTAAAAIHATARDVHQQKDGVKLAGLQNAISGLVVCVMSMHQHRAVDTKADAASSTAAALLCTTHHLIP